MVTTVADAGGHKADVVCVNVSQRRLPLPLDATTAADVVRKRRTPDAGAPTA